MKDKIIFQKCNYNNIYFLIYIIMYFVNIIIAYNLELSVLSNIKESYLKNAYLASSMFDNFYIYNVCDFLAIIPYFIMKILLKKKKKIIEDINDENNTIDDAHLIYNDKEKSETKKKKNTIIIFCLCVVLFDFLERFALLLYNIIYPDKKLDIYTFNCLIPFGNILQFICSYFILKIHFYKLQYFSIYLNLGIFIIILIFDLINILKNNAFDGKAYIFYPFSIIFYSIEYSCGKRILLNGFISIHLLIIIKGIFGLFLVLILSLITYLVNKEVIFIIGLFLKEKKNIWLIIVKIFSDYFVTLFTWVLIDRFSPNYLPFTLISDEVCNFLLEIIYGSDITQGTMKWDLYIRIFLYIISFIGVMIHNEIVVINICNLGSDTKYFLDKELEKEELFTKTDNPEIIKRYETLIEMEDGNSKEDDGEN